MELPTWARAVTLICPWVESIADNWLRELPALRHVTFADMSSLQTVGHRWMSECPSLVSVEFSGLPALTTVGRGWLSACPSLVSVDFRGLSSVRSVNTFWLYDCPRLTSPDFRGLSTIDTIGHGWMYKCPALVAPTFSTRIRERRMSLCLISLEGTFSRIHEVRYFYVNSPASSYIKLRLLMYELAGKRPLTSLILPLVTKRYALARASACSTLRGTLLYYLC
jgi:hypothetical protein